jgi:quinoprotein glucose dehydrogenase
MRLSPLTQINRANAAGLRVAWTFHTHDVAERHGHTKRSGFESTPLVVDGTLYLTTPFNRVIALDPETGAQRWSYDPKIELAGDYGDGLVNRGVATWVDATRANGRPCRRRIFEATLDARLVAIDAATGSPCADFGTAGQVSLRNVPRYESGWYHMTSPPAVVDGVVIVGSAIDDNHRVDMASGVVRAYDARTGLLRWSWDPLPPNSSVSIPAGNVRPQQIPPGSISLGGPIVTAGGLVFIAGTTDSYIRGFDVETAKSFGRRYSQRAQTLLRLPINYGAAEGNTL